MELKPCPFCGKNNSGVHNIGHTSSLVVFCLDCGCDGPARLNAKESIEAWNTRADLDKAVVAAKIEALNKALAEAQNRAIDLEEYGKEEGLTIQINQAHTLYAYAEWLEDELLKPAIKELENASPKI